MNVNELILKLQQIPGNPSVYVIDDRTGIGDEVLGCIESTIDSSLDGTIRDELDKGAKFCEIFIG